MTTNEHTLYFAYGSNLDLVGMQYRAPEATRLSSAQLDDWRLTFRGVADIEPASGRVVHGAIWLLTEENVLALDRYEGHPHYYRRQAVTVRNTENDLVEAMTYVMLPEYQDKEGLPTKHYLQSIIDGYEAFRLPLVPLGLALQEIREKLVAPGERPWRSKAKEQTTSGMSPATKALYALEEAT